MLDEVLRIASHIPHPLAAAGFALVLSVVVVALLLRAKKTFLAAAIGLVIFVLGFAPLAASAILRSRGVYRIRVVLIRPDDSVADIAQVRSSIGGELKMVGDGWELEIPQQSRPADGKVTFTASVKDEFLAGKSTLVLVDDYYPTATIELDAVTSAKLRGVVVDEGMHAITGAQVSIEGCPDVAVSDAKGNFVLLAHAGNGQMVEVHAKKGQLTGHLSAPAGKAVEVILSSE